MTHFKNSHGQWFRSGIGGTYPVNNGDPQNDDPEFDDEAAERAYDDAVDGQAQHNSL